MNKQITISKGDTERQALQRDKLIKRKSKVEKDEYTTRLLDIIKDDTILCDLGCGTANVIQKLASVRKTATFIGLDASTSMLNIAKTNNKNLPNVMFVTGDNYILPFYDNSLNVVTSRLAEYSISEAHRVLIKNGYLFEYGLGPEANREIARFFPDKICKENFFFPTNPIEWKDEVCRKVEEHGFIIESMDEFKEKEYYKDEEELIDLIEMVPLLSNFDRKKDKPRLQRLSNTYVETEGVGITWHYYILKAKRT